MRSLLRWVATALLVGVGSVLLATPAAAHPTDEVVQQLYLTPAASGLTVQLDLTPGVLVGPQFAATVDTDGDGAASAAEVTAHVAAVRSAVTATVDGAAVDLVVTGTQYPPAELLAAAGGTVTLTMTAPVAADTHRLTVADTYEPGIKSAVQMSVLVPPDPIPLGRIGHADGGRSMTVALNPGTTTAPEAVAGAPATAGSSMLDALRRPLTSPWALLVLIGACCLLGALHALTPGHGKALPGGRPGHGPARRHARPDDHLHAHRCGARSGRGRPDRGVRRVRVGGSGAHGGGRGRRPRARDPAGPASVDGDPIRRPPTGTGPRSPATGTDTATGTGTSGC